MIDKSWTSLFKQAQDMQGKLSEIQEGLAGKTVDVSTGGGMVKIVANGLHEIITIDKSGVNKAAIEEYNIENDTSIEIRQIKYLNNIVEQDHRGIKPITKHMLGFKSCHSASVTLNGIELVRMLKKGQTEFENNFLQTTAELFYDLASQ